MAHDAMDGLPPNGADGAARPQAEAPPRGEDFDPLCLGYEAADPALQALLWGETPASRESS